MQRMRVFASTWLLWRLCAAGPWLWMTAAVVQRATGYNLPCPGLAFFAPLIPLAVYISKGDVSNIVCIISYTIIFPVVVLVLIGRRAPRLFSAGWRWFRRATSLWASAAYALTLIFLSIGLLIVGNPTAVAVLVSIQAVLMVLFLIATVRLASDPLWPFHSFLVLVKGVQSAIEKIPSSTPKSEAEEKKSRESILKALGYAEIAFEAVMGAIDHTIKRTLVPVFCAYLMLVFTFTVIQFSIATYALQQQDPNNFDQLDPAYGRCFVYALSMIVTVPISNVVPKTDMAHFVYGAEVVSIFLLISVFLSMFSTSISVHGEHKQIELQQISQAVRDWIADRKKTANGEVIDGSVVAAPAPPADTGSRALVPISPPPTAINGPS